ncbi:Ig-like domain repeat protein [Rhodococcus opacus]|nr:Ig-like domain repeat protein [Rhodococcus opacus]
MFTLGAAAAAMVLAATPAAAVDITTTTTVSVLGTVATTCPVTVTATVTPVTPPTPVFTGGTVVFKDGNTPIGVAAAVTNGTASVNHTFTTTGMHVVVATFGGVTIGTNVFKSSTFTLNINVATGLNLGSACLPIG